MSIQWISDFQLWNILIYVQKLTLSGRIWLNEMYFKNQDSMSLQLHLNLSSKLWSRNIILFSDEHLWCSFPLSGLVTDSLLSAWTDSISARKTEGHIAQQQ